MFEANKSEVLSILQEDDWILIRMKAILLLSILIILQTEVSLCYLSIHQSIGYGKAIRKDFAEAQVLVTYCYQVNWLLTKKKGEWEEKKVQDKFSLWAERIVNPD